jgi:molybdopterin converting factor small subunit
MKVKVKLFTTLREGRGKELMVELEEGDTPQKVIDILNIKKEDVAILLINGRSAEFDAKLAEGDVLSLFPPVGGG